MKKLLFIIILLLTCLQNYGQETASTITQEIISNSIKNKASSDQIKKLDAFYLGSIIGACNEHLSDSLASVRKAVYEIVYIMALHKLGEPEVKKAINILLLGCKDRDAGIVYSNLNYLRYFKQMDFDAEARIKLAQMAREGTSYFAQVIRLTGMAGITDLKYDFQEMLQQQKYTDKKIQWNLRIALARLGDKDAEVYCINRIKKLILSDDVVYDLLPDLAYIRTKDAFDYLLDVVKSNEMNCTSSNPDSDSKINCAFRVIKLIAPYINEFPVKVDKTGNIIEKDYDKLLLTVREWIDTNKSSYTLDTQIY